MSFSIWAGLAAALIGAGAAGTAEQFTQTVDHLAEVSPERRADLAANPDGLTPVELNARVPEINQVELDNSFSDAAPGGTLKVIAWNIERGRAWEGALKLIAEDPALKNPDVLLLTEMDLGMARSKNRHTTREMAAGLGMNYAYAVEFLELSRGKSADLENTGDRKNERGFHGNAILSRFPLSNVRMLRFPGIEKWYGSGENRLGGRMAVIAEIDASGTPITLVSVHLESGITDTEQRALEMRLLLEELKATAWEHPIIIGGDMNSLHTHEAIEQLRGAGFDVDAANDLDTPTSQYLRKGKAHLGGPHIDYVQARGLEVIRGEHSPAVVLGTWPPGPGGELLSDHAAVVCVFEVRP